MRSLQAGHSYVSDGKTHLIDFKINGMPADAGTTGGEVQMSTPGNVTATVGMCSLRRVGPGDIHYVQVVHPDATINIWGTFHL